MVAVMILVLGFKSSNNLAAAYGIAVTGDMVITSILATVVAAKVWKWGWIRASLLFSCFLAPSNWSSLTANVLKIPDGGWFPLVAGMVTFILMTTWKRGRQLLSDRLRGERLELSMFLDSLGSSMPTRVAGTSVFLNADPKWRAARHAAQPDAQQGAARAGRPALGPVLRHALRAGYRPGGGAPDEAKISGAWSFSTASRTNRTCRRRLLFAVTPDWSSTRWKLPISSVARP
jgi:hypothetical protein